VGNLEDHHRRVTMKAGSNALSITAISANGGPNIDKFDIT
jgi:hypothetical protein